MLQRGNLMLLMSCVLLIICLVAISKLNSAKAGLQDELDACRRGGAAATVAPPSSEAEAGHPATETPPTGPPESSATETGPAAERPPSGPLPGLGKPGAGKPPSGPRGLGLTPEGREFFRAHPALLERALRIMRTAASREREGADTSSAGAAFRAATQAAAGGQSDRVSELLADAERALGIPTGPELEGLRERVKAFEKTLDEAARAGKDVKELAPLVRRINEALRKGDTKKAEQLVREGMDRLNKMAPTRPPHGGTAERPSGPGGPSGMAEVLALVMEREVKNLRAIDDDLSNAKLVLRSGTPEQAEEIIDNALTELNRIRNRRRALTEAATAAAQRAGAPVTKRPPGAGPRAVVPPSFDPEHARDELFAAFNRVRGLSQEQYEADREKLFKQIVERWFPPPPAEARRMTPLQQKLDASAREKLRLAEEALAKRKAAGEDVAEIEAKMKRAHKYLAEGEWELADGVASEVIEALGVSPPAASAAPKAEK